MRIAVAGGTGVVGRHVVQAGRDAGHDLVTLTRSCGVDVISGEGLAQALSDVDVVIDTTNPETNEQTIATNFFIASMANLSRFGERAGVRHLVVLSIVGIDDTSTGYYGAKLAQEQAALASFGPTTIVRTTQFHEFPAQMINRNPRNSVVELQDVWVQTIAAATVGRILVEVAEGSPKKRVNDIGGPKKARLVELAQSFIEQFGLDIEVLPLNSHLEEAALLPTAGARIEGPTFQEWLLGDDAAKIGGMLQVVSRRSS